MMFRKTTRREREISGICLPMITPYIPRAHTAKHQSSNSWQESITPAQAARLQADNGFACRLTTFQQSLIGGDRQGSMQIINGATFGCKCDITDAVTT
jgi:hypothetical protein